MQITADTVIRTASIYQGLTARAVDHETYRYHRTFRGCFGVCPELAAELWNMLDDADPMSDIRWVTYFLATLMFLRTYTVTAVLAMIFMKDEKTIRHWVWVFIEKIATLDLVSDEQEFAFFFIFIHRRLHQQRALTMYMLLHSNTTPPDQMGVPTMNDNGSRCLVTVDGTDFRIREPGPFSTGWFTKKFNGPGLRYEIAVCIQTGWIVWINGPFPCGEWVDIAISLSSLVHMFEGDERAVADKGYRGYPQYFDCPWRHLDNQQQTSRKALARARHECVNRRLKEWSCLLQRWRHSLDKHGKMAMLWPTLCSSKLWSGQCGRWTTMIESTMSLTLIIIK
ncbi:unknown protein [Seminavis robusta]|uniref:DDE Tnp4 domain-containing protein n=1 Tax=Seminavis robusta TaxID=568900 RepID=A0A9N8ER96_9STRA|nr:unknown protein [Seminavis robusta]|eukprot:Sro1390_g268700.1 n/a (338) ;mRNA; f:25233-26246